MSQQKRVQIRCNFPLGRFRHHDIRLPWEDMYLRWKGKPGRKTHYACPMLGCAAELPVELVMHEKIRGVREDRQDWYREDDENIKNVLRDLVTREYAMTGEGAGLCIYTKAKGIDAREAERMLAWYLETAHGVRNPKFIWKRSKFIVTPMGFGDYTDGDTTPIGIFRTINTQQPVATEVEAQ